MGSKQSRIQDKINHMGSRKRGRGAGIEPPMAAAPPIGQRRPKPLLHPAPPLPLPCSSSRRRTGVPVGRRALQATGAPHHRLDGLHQPPSLEGRRIRRQWLPLLAAPPIHQLEEAEDAREEDRREALPPNRRACTHLVATTPSMAATAVSTRGG
jgi:hypothetical protein